MIAVRDISKQFGGLKALRECSFHVSPNKITSIIGPNGAGKTTIFNVICGLIKPDKGKVFFNKKDITNKQPHVLSKALISRTFQQARLFENMTVKDNLLLARDCSTKEIQAALDQVHFPLSMRKKASDLSYGQSRLVEIARALIKPHKLLMLDEPTAGVNPKVRASLKQILLELKKTDLRYC